MVVIDDLDEETAFALLAAHILDQVKSGKMRTFPFHVEILD